MEFALLGPLSVVRGGVPVAVSGVHQRAVLACLLLHENEVVATSRLLRMIWGDDVPRTARKMLQNAVSSLRGLLATETGSGGPILLTHAPGYLLQVDHASIDRNRFRDLAERGRTQLRAGDAGEAADTLRTALRMWRGDALADLVELGFDWPELGVLREDRIAVLEDCFEAELASGRHSEVIGELEMAQAAEPLRERLCGLLMLAAYRSGRQRDALAAYRRLRQRLVGELGVEPGDALRTLEHDILNHDPALRPADDMAQQRVPVQRTAEALTPAVEPAPAVDPEPTVEHGSLTVVLVTSITEHAASVGEFVREQIRRHGGMPTPGPGSSWCGYFGAADHAQRALTAAGTIARQSVVDFPAASVRVAMHTGAVVLGGATDDETVPPPVASGVLDSCRRLAAAASPGHVVVNAPSDGPEPRRSEPPVTSVPVVADPVAPTRPWPTPTPFVGRAFESDMLFGLVRRVRGTGRPSMATLIGERGVGKTRLVTEFAEQIRNGQPEQTHVLRATVPAGRSSAVDLLAGLVRDGAGLRAGAGADEVDRGLSAALTALAAPGADTDHLLAALRTALVPGADLGRADDVVESCRTFLHLLAAATPTVVIVEDVHHASDDVRAALVDLADGRRSVPLLVLTTARPEFARRAPMWGSVLPNALSFVLDRLPDNAITRLLDSVLPPRRQAMHFGRNADLAVPGHADAGPTQPWRRLLAAIDGSPGRALTYAHEFAAAPDDLSANAMAMGALHTDVSATNQVEALPVARAETVRSARGVERTPVDPVRGPRQQGWSGAALEFAR